MVKTKYRRYLLISVIVMIVLMMFLGNRLLFGVWNPMRLPERIDCFGRRYSISNHKPRIIVGEKTPEYEIEFWDSWSGKALYMMEEKGELVPTVIYLKMIDGKYQIYELSGGQ